MPVNPAVSEVLGEQSYPSLSAIPFPVDIVDVFRQSHAIPLIAEEAVNVGAKTLWLQMEVISLEGAAIARCGGQRVVMNRCLKVDHRAVRDGRWR